MLLTLKLFLRRMRWLLRNRLGFVKYTVGPSPLGWRRAMLRSHNQRRERGNVARYLGQRRGKFHATC